MLIRINVDYIVRLLLVSYFYYVPTVAQKEGITCKQIDGSEGVCKFIGNCPPALELSAQGIDPEELNPVCGHIGTKTLVCCDHAAAETTPSELTSVPEPLVIKTVKYTDRKAGETSQQKCKEYAKYVTDTVPTATLGIYTSYETVFECAFEQEPLIARGVPAARKEFPHMALIGYKTGSEIQWGCGGSVISEQFILTAAHCLDDAEKGKVKFVKLGLLKTTDTDNVQNIAASEIIFHPEYNYTQYHDIGLIKLSKPIALNTAIRPACLQTEKNIPSQRAIVSGWGATRLTMIGISDELMKANLDFFDPHICNTTYKNTINMKDSRLKDGILGDFMICAGSRTDKKDTCKGDSGGPIQIYHPTEKDNIRCMYDIVGVTSFGQACGLAANLPGIYTRVSAYIKWIEDVVWP